MVLPARPKTKRRGLIAGDGGTAKLRCELPATANHGWLNQARCELHEVTMVLTRQRKGDGKIPSYPGHGGLNSGEVTPMAVTAGMVTVTLPKHERRS